MSVAAPLVLIGADVRHWITFRVIDATAEEVETLSRVGTPEALALAGALFEGDRLQWVADDCEQDPDPFEEHREPNVIDLDPATEAPA